MNFIIRNSNFFLLTTACFIAFYSLNNCRQISKEILEDSSINVIQKVSKKIGLNVANDIPDDLVQQITEKRISVESEKILIKKLSSNNQLKELFINDHSFIEIYKSLSYLPSKFSLDKNILKWKHSLENGEKTPFIKAFKSVNIETDELSKSLYFIDEGKIIGEYSDGIISCKGGFKNQFNQVTESNKLLNINLLPNTLYKIENKFIYKSDEFGRISEVRTISPLSLNNRGRNIKTQSYVNYLKDGIYRESYRQHDNAGHIIAQRFDGVSEQINFFPQLPEANLGSWKTMENFFVQEIEKNNKVNVLYKLDYDGLSKRPSSVRVRYTINKEKPIDKIFNN